MGLIDIATSPARAARRVSGHLANRAVGQLRELRGGKPKDLDDVTIARKVETEIFRTRSVDKGKIDVNVVDGVVYLRGIAKNPAQVKAVEAKTRAIPEVVDVENLLHLAKTPAPTRARRSKTAPGAPRTTGGRVNADTTVKTAGDTPADLAAKRQGRVATEARSQRESAGSPADGESRFERPDPAPKTNGTPSPDAG